MCRKGFLHDGKMYYLDYYDKENLSFQGSLEFPEELEDYIASLHHHRAERIRILEAADQQAKDEQLTLNLELDEHEE
tara:strand:+ start:586 stop:816 length:231 start_codon:yes stop_codon:yes gene_type:complete